MAESYHGSACNERQHNSRLEVACNVQSSGRGRGVDVVSRSERTGGASGRLRLRRRAPRGLWWLPSYRRMRPDLEGTAVSGWLTRGSDAGSLAADLGAPAARSAAGRYRSPAHTSGRPEPVWPAHWVRMGLGEASGRPEQRRGPGVDLVSRSERTGSASGRLRLRRRAPRGLWCTPSYRVMR